MPRPCGRPCLARFSFHGWSKTSPRRGAFIKWRRVMARPIPDGFRTITPHLIIKNAGQAIDFYKKAFGAEEVMRMPGPDGKAIMHAELKIGDSMFMVADEFPQMGCISPQTLGNSPVGIHLYVSDVDSIFNQAVKAGATVKMPIT